MRIIYAFLIFVGILLLILPVAVPIIKTSAEFSMFNTKWNGCSKFAKLLYERGEVIPIIYPYNSVKVSKLKGVLVVIGPDIDFSKLEAEEVKKFLENGGTLFIADDFGTANSLLKKIGVKARFSDKQLKDLFYSKNYNFPVVVRIKDPRLSVGVKNITLNIPSAIVGGDGKIFSSKVSIIGKNMKSYPILAEIRYKKGKIIMLSDPSILINDMFERNRKFIENLVEYLGSNVFYFDEAHHSDFNPYSIATVYVHREFDREKAFQVFLFVSALAVFIESGMAKKILQITTDFIFRFASRKEEDLFKDLPDWVDRKTLERIIHEIRTGSKLGDRYGRKRIHRKVKERSEQSGSR